MALRNEEQDGINIYIYKLHFYSNEWEEFSFIYKEHDYNKRGNTRQSFTCARGVQRPGKAGVIRTGTGLLARAPGWCDYHRHNDDWQGRKTRSINFWALSCIWKMKHEENTILSLAQTRLSPVPTWTKKIPQAEDRQSRGTPTPTTATTASLLTRAPRVRTPCFASAGHSCLYFYPLWWKFLHHSPLGLLCQPARALNSSEPKALVCELTPYD